jgi:hypothetical protein
VNPNLSISGLHRLALASALVVASHAQAETSPYYIGISQTFGYDSNIFRRDDRTITIPNPSDPANPFVQKPVSSGLISTTSILGGFSQPIGRQRVFLDGSAGYASYGDQPQLNTPVYSIRGGIEWETAEKWSGLFALSANQNQGQYANEFLNDVTGVVTRVTGGKLIDNSQRADFVARYGSAATSRVWLEGGVSYNHLTQSSEFRPITIDTAQLNGSDEDYESVALSLGARTLVSGALTAGAGIRTVSLTTSTTPRYVNNVPPPGAVQAPDEVSRRNSIDFFADWVASGASTVNARLSYGKTTYEEPYQDQDQSNWTGDLIWSWQPTGKSSMTTRLSYDFEDRTYGYGPDSNFTGGTSYYTSLGWTGRYAATGKVNLDGSAQFTWQADYDQADLRIGFTYQALRAVSTGCSLGYFSQVSSGRIESTKTAYMPSCFIQAILQ